jgi:hypothetical protein
VKAKCSLFQATACSEWHGLCYCVRVKVNLPLYIIKYYAVKTYGRESVWFEAFLTAALDVVE